MGDKLEDGLWTLLSVEELALAARSAEYSSVILIEWSGDQSAMRVPCVTASYQ